MVGRRSTVGGRSFRLLALLLACAGPAFGCGKRSAEGPAAGAPVTIVVTSADAAAPGAAAVGPATDVPPLPEAAESDDGGAAEEAGTDEGPAPPEWPDVPLADLRELPALEQACKRKDWAACVALADRLADGAAEERDEARADGLYSRACEQGRRVDACRRLGLRLLRAAATPAGGREAGLRLEQACAGGFLDACTALGEAKVRGERVSRDVYLGLQGLQRACNAGHAAACATVRSLRVTAESYDLPLPRAIPPKPVVPGKEPSAEAVCPARFHGAAAVPVRERLDGGLRRLSPEVLAAAVPGTVDGWTVERPAVSDGDSFLRGTVVGARFVADDRSVELVVRDRATECTLQPGTGEAMLARTGRGAEGRRRAQVRGEPAVLAGSSAARMLTFWLAERCEVRLAGSGVSDDRLLELARALDLPALRRECARREAADGTAVYEP